jgi:hypothetical protein
LVGLAGEPGGVSKLPDDCSKQVSFHAPYRLNLQVRMAYGELLLGEMPVHWGKCLTFMAHCHEHLTFIDYGSRFSNGVQEWVVNNSGMMKSEVDQCFRGLSDGGSNASLSALRK